MKTRILTLVALFFAASATTFAQSKQIDTKESNVNWTGYKVTGQHEGTINFKSGTLEFEDGKLVGGTFVIDMASINTTDLSGKSKQSLDGHLKSDDFFGVATYPTATLIFKKVVETDDNVYRVAADLKIKESTSRVAFDIELEDDSAQTTFKVDRTKFGIKYGSASFFDGLKDKAINDEFDLAVSLKY
ncbi:polyisoprenoid-binding protein YceI [Kordia periserrulae]|uniref:Polyisoprenoid-binding protein YceI n=1 Tax=Kordia periserrulae TaxID=701523 RepID=A0A2T6C537_9FLAO|nr:YceI family protein [Kordia periserrulae]PTX63438.1 polyisoprenoid-binding protein YceI [Kordia periserrulae]